MIIDTRQRLQKIQHSSGDSKQIYDHLKTDRLFSSYEPKSLTSDLSVNSNESAPLISSSSAQVSYWESFKAYWQADAGFLFGQWNYPGSTSHERYVIASITHARYFSLSTKPIVLTLDEVNILKEKSVPHLLPASFGPEAFSVGFSFSYALPLAKLWFNESLALWPTASLGVLCISCVATYTLGAWVGRSLSSPKIEIFGYSLFGKVSDNFSLVEAALEGFRLFFVLASAIISSNYAEKFSLFSRELFSARVGTDFFWREETKLALSSALGGTLAYMISESFQKKYRGLNYLTAIKQLLSDLVKGIAAFMPYIMIDLGFESQMNFSLSDWNIYESSIINALEKMIDYYFWVRGTIFNFDPRNIASAAYRYIFGEEKSYSSEIEHI